jgi:hypothetical protein
VRKVSTRDLSRWDDAIQAAIRTDDGSGKELTKTLDRIRHEARDRLKR